MPSIRIKRFAGLLPEVSPKLLREDHAQIAHNTLLWDGQLKPLPAWRLLSSTPGTVASLFADPRYQTQFNVDTTLIHAQLAIQEPYPVGYEFGIDQGQVKFRPPGASTVFTCPPIPAVSGVTQYSTPQYQSVYPIPRTYCVTTMSGNMESPPFVFPGLGDDGTLFEGDVVSLQWTIAFGAFNNVTGCRLYRTIPGFDTAEQIGNPRETAFHLVAEMDIGSGSFFYVDSQDSSQILGDRLMTEQFVPPMIQSATFLGQTETGWLVAAGVRPSTGYTEFQVSERFLWHAWPLQNFVQIPDVMTDAVTFYDEVFIGTAMRPYHMRVTFSDNVEIDSLDITVRPFPDVYACVPNTMVTTNFGAMYASPDGLVALEINEDSMSTKKVTNPGDHLRNPIFSMKIADAQSAAWWNGFYVGFLSGVAYLFNTENSHNNEFPLGQLVTFTTPPGFPGLNLVIGSTALPGNAVGLVGTWGNQFYYWPMPGYGYESASLLEYTWRSKIFVMPGGTTFAAAKVVGENLNGTQCNFYGDGDLIYSVALYDNNPFRIPHNHSCIQWEIEFIGQATISEVHLATSMRELTEEQGVP